MVVQTRHGGGASLAVAFGLMALALAGGLATDRAPRPAAAEDVETGGGSFPTFAAVQPTYGGGATDAFAAGFDIGLTTQLYATYLGGTTPDAAHGVRADTASNAWLTGTTEGAPLLGCPSSPPCYPHTAGSTTYQGGASDGFVTVLAPGGTSILGSGFYGSNGDDLGWDMALLDQAAVGPQQPFVLVGQSIGTAIPGPTTLMGGWTVNGPSDAYVAILECTAC